MNNKIIRILSLVLILAVALVGCGPKESPNTPDNTTDNNGEAKTDIVIATAVDFITMDPLDTNDTLSGGLQRAMMEGLFGFDHEMNVVPLLAEDYEANDEATEFTFKLRQGVKFSDGTDFNADSALVNLNRMADQTQGLKRNSLFNMIDKNEKIDDYTIKVTLKQSFGAFINTLAHPAALFVSPAALEEYGNEVSQHPVGTGRYIFEKWTPGEQLVIKQNSNYWGGAPEFTSVTFKPVVENGTRVAMLQSGDADFIFPLPSEQVASLQANKDLTVEVTPSIVTRYITMNTQKKPFDDVRVRQALNYAVDKEAYAQVVYNGYAKPAVSLIGPNVQFHVAQDPYEYDIEKAKALLADAGYPNGFEVSLWSSNTTTMIKATQFIKQQLSEIGVTVNVENMEIGTLDQQVTGYAKGTPGDQVGVEMYVIGWSPSTGDADWGLRPLASSESIPPVSYNIAYYSSPVFDAAIQAALETADPEKRAEQYAIAQKQVWEDAPMIFTVVDDNTFAHRNTVDGIVILPDGSLDLSQGKVVK
jgi:glutathione transport system substrate-binding protein